MRDITITNEQGKIVAKLYILPNGDLHADSWLCHEGLPPIPDPLEKGSR